MNIHFSHRITAAPKTLAPGQPNCLYHRLGRRFLAAWILPLLLLLALPEAVQAQFTFTTNNGAITITGYTGPGGAVDIPSTIIGLPVTSIGNGAFHSCTSLTGVYFWGNAPRPCLVCVLSCHQCDRLLPAWNVWLGVHV